MLSLHPQVLSTTMFGERLPVAVVAGSGLVLGGVRLRRNGVYVGPL